MADNLSVGERQQAADFFSRKMPDAEILGLSPADIITELGDKSKYHFRRLSLEQPGPDTELNWETARHWRALVIGSGTQVGLIEFGTSAANVGGYGNEDCLQQHSQILDLVLEEPLQHPACEAFFSELGERHIDLARSAGHRVFAALEVRYAPVEDEIRLYPAVSFTNTLLDAYSEISFENPPIALWRKQAATPENSENTAFSIVAGAFQHYSR